MYIAAETSPEIVPDCSCPGGIELAQPDKHRSQMQSNLCDTEFHDQSIHDHHGHYHSDSSPPRVKSHISPPGAQTTPASNHSNQISLDTEQPELLVRDSGDLGATASGGSASSVAETVPEITANTPNTDSSAESSEDASEPHAQAAANSDPIVSDSNVSDQLTSCPTTSDASDSSGLLNFHLTSHHQGSSGGDEEPSTSRPRQRRIGISATPTGPCSSPEVSDDDDSDSEGNTRAKRYGFYNCFPHCYIKLNFFI